MKKSVILLASVLVLSAGNISVSAHNTGHEVEKELHNSIHVAATAYNNGATMPDCMAMCQDKLRAVIEDHAESLKKTK